MIPTPSKVREWAVNCGPHEERWNLVVSIRNSERTRDPSFNLLGVTRMTDDEIAPYIARMIMEETEI